MKLNTTAALVKSVVDAVAVFVVADALLKLCIAAKMALQMYLAKLLGMPAGSMGAQWWGVTHSAAQSLCLTTWWWLKIALARVNELLFWYFQWQRISILGKYFLSPMKFRFNI